MQVYVPLRVPGRPALAFAAYCDYAQLNLAADQVLNELIPVVLAPLVLVQLVHIPIAASWSARVKRQESERFKLLELTLSASERERVRIAADLHDGPIQELAGFGYAFELWTASLPEPEAPMVQQLQAAVQRSIESLRRLMIDLYPPDLGASQLPRTIFDLAVPLRQKGIEVTVTVSALPELDPDTVTALYRIAREALANVAEHAAATAVTVNLGRRGPEEHRVRALGGSLTMTTGPQGGAVITAVLPNDSGTSGGQPADRVAGRSVPLNVRNGGPMLPATRAAPRRDPRWVLEHARAAPPP